MRTVSRAFLLFAGTYFFDFATSALFISLGYGFAETNLAQTALVSAPGLGTLLAWLVNQNIRLALLAVGLIALAFPSVPAERLHLGFIFGALSLIRLYGVATNLGFIVSLASGVSIPALGYYVPMFALAIVAFSDGLRDGLRGEAQALFRGMTISGLGE